MKDEERIEEEFNNDLKRRILDFINDFDPADDRDPYYVAEIIYGVPEDKVRDWHEESLEEKPRTISIHNEEEPQSDFERIVHSLDSIRKSVLKLDAYNKQLMEELKKKMGKKPE